MEKVRLGEQPIAQVLSLSYSFDHAQQIHYPSNLLQPGPMYFNIGVCSEGEATQLY